MKSNEDAVPTAVLPKHCCVLLHKNAVKVQKEPCASRGIVCPQNGEDCENNLLLFLKTSVQEGGYKW